MADSLDEHHSMADGGQSDPEDGATTGEDARDREVVVPMSLYKTVTVYSTLLAVLLVVFGFMFLDAATGQMSLLLSVMRFVPVTIPTPDPGTTSAIFAFLGLLTILAGAWVYVLGARFRAEGMGTDKGEGE